jgi:hemerythrin-like domain-containing protein
MHEYLTSGAPIARITGTMRSIAIIQDEHRSLGAVLHGMRYLVRQIRDKGATPDFELLRAMIYYIDAVPERFHHPKEEQYLFWLLRIRRPSAAPLLDRLKLEHRVGAEKIRILEQALLHYRQGGKIEFPPFLAALEAYATFHWAHMKIEENEILPLAERHLTAGDWEAIDAAFLGHTDPLLGVEAGAKYEALFSRIVNLVPPPVGVGPARRPA